MNRILASSLLAFAIAGSAGAANAATTTLSAQPVSTANTSSTAVNYAAQCRTLGKQWASASAANSSNKHFAAAKADAAKGMKLCKSTKTASRQKGAGQYAAALKLIGVSPTI